MAGEQFRGPMRNIKRVREGKRHPGWTVHFRRGEEHTKTFSDMEYGGKEAALRAATAYRDEQERQRLYMDKIEFSQILKSTNTSGVTGVRYVEIQGRHGQPYRYWEAYWSFGGRRKTKMFKISEHGMEGAKQLAVDARRKAEADYHASKQNRQTPWRDCIVQPHPPLTSI